MPPSAALAREVTESYHPNIAGQAFGYLPALLGTPPTSQSSSSTRRQAAAGDLLLGPEELINRLIGAADGWVADLTGWLDGWCLTVTGSDSGG